MRIKGIDSYVLRDTGPAGASDSTLVRIRLENGLHGWGESAANLAPEAVSAIVRSVFAPLLAETVFEGSAEEIERAWESMHAALRPRGLLGGFASAAAAAIDIGLWDLAGKLARKPVAELLNPGARPRVPGYLAVLPAQDRWENVRRYFDAGFRLFKMPYEGDPGKLFRGLEALPGGSRTAVDARWSLAPESALEFAHECEARQVLWLECPFSPEDPLAHAALAAQLTMPIAIGVSCRTSSELAPYLRERAFGVFQPGASGSGITGSLLMTADAAEHGAEVIPHSTPGYGPALAATIHFAAASPACQMIEVNPFHVAQANRMLVRPLSVAAAEYAVPAGPGLGVEFDEAKLERFRTSA
jgi:D-galactarolactone cycloisomerase